MVVLYERSNVYYELRFVTSSKLYIFYALHDYYKGFSFYKFLVLSRGFNLSPLED